MCTTYEYQLNGFFFFNDPATTEIYTLSLHDALPISSLPELRRADLMAGGSLRLLRCAQSGASHAGDRGCRNRRGDRKSTRLNSSHSQISYAVFCLKKKKKNKYKYSTHNIKQATT